MNSWWLARQTDDRGFKEIKKQNGTCSGRNSGL